MTGVFANVSTKLAEALFAAGALSVPPLRFDEALAAYVTSRDLEVTNLAGALREGELVTVSAADPSLAGALADAAALALATHDGWVVARADARLATNETALARVIAQSALDAYVRLEFERQSQTAPAGPSKLTDRVRVLTERAHLAARRALGERVYALATGEHTDAAAGVGTLGLATEAVIALRRALSGNVVFVLHGVDELARPGRSRFADGQQALWLIRGAWQREHGPAILSGGPGAAAMSIDKQQAFYGYGQLHQAADLPDAQLAEAFGELLGDLLDDDGLREAQQLIGQALWLAPALRVCLPGRRRAGSAVVWHAWERLVAQREVEHHQLLRALSRVHRLALPVLDALAHHAGQYAALGHEGRRDDDISRALLALAENGAVHRLGQGRWRLADPTLATTLRWRDRESL